VLVHAIPASDVQEYQGMPMFAEVGPLECDPAVTQQVQRIQAQDQVLVDQVTVDNLEHAQV